MEYTAKNIEFTCTGHYVVERVGYYAGCSTLENFKVFLGSTEVTDSIDKDMLEDMKRTFIEMCENEECA